MDFWVPPEITSALIHSGPGQRIPMIHCLAEFFKAQGETGREHPAGKPQKPRENGLKALRRIGDPALSGVTFGAIAERWISTKATRAPKTVAGYRSLLDTLVLPRWRDVPLSAITFDALQAWISGLSANGSTRYEGKGLSASRVRQPTNSSARC